MPCPGGLRNFVPAAPPAASPCAWCDTDLPALVAVKKLEATLKQGAAGGDVKPLHEHLKRFGMTIELGDWHAKDGTFADSADLTKGSWGAPTSRAVRMFGLHAAVDKDTARVIKTDGKALNAALVAKIQDWCRGKIVSPANYWDVKDLKIGDGDVDAAGSHDAYEKQTVMHDYIVQIERDLMKTGFAKHKDALCEIGADHKVSGKLHAVPSGSDDIHLTDVTYLITKFQRQSQWLWRMKTDGTVLPDVTASDPSVCSGGAAGTADTATAKALHAWVTAGYHIAVKYFNLKDLHWPPDSSDPIINEDDGTTARLREDAYPHWLAAAKKIQELGGTIRGLYSSSPRAWTHGKKKSKTAGSFSWHYAALGVDIGGGAKHGLRGYDGTTSATHPYGIEKDGRFFKLWCWIVPQPKDPPPPEKDVSDPFVQYRNRHKGTTPVVHVLTNDLNAAGTDYETVVARTGWYLNITAVMASEGLERTELHKEVYLTDLKASEWWHYQFRPPLPPGASVDPTFGEFLQLYGVHEARLREKGWSTHDDIDHVMH